LIAKLLETPKIGIDCDVVMGSCKQKGTTNKLYPNLENSILARQLHLLVLPTPKTKMGFVLLTRSIWG
jgi:hypothetical protein